ncbi:MAG: GNAT family N-acetyltransferase [Balneolales bacterium]
MIREFTSNDIDQVLSIWLDASIRAHDFVDRYFWESKLDDMRDVYIPGSETFVYDDEGTIKGFFSLYENTLAAIFVSPDCQSGGIGGKLLGKAKELREILTLEVYKKNEKSVRFYEMCGFRKVSEKIDPLTGQLVS